MNEPNPTSLDLWPTLLLPSHSRALAREIEQLNADEWFKLLFQARHHGLEVLLMTNAQPHLSPTILKAPQYASTSSHIRKQVLRSMVHQSELMEILGTLTKLGLTPLVFKGAILAHTIYRSPACRPMSDIDLWLPDEQLADAQTALEQIGYVQILLESRPLALQRHTDGEIQLAGTKEGQGVIELHWGVFAGEWLSVASAIDRRAVWDRRQLFNLFGNEIFVLDPVDNLLQVVVHLGINHQMTKSALRSLVDVALLCEQGVDWEAFQRRAHEWQIASVAGLTLQLIDDLFSMSALRPVIGKLLPSTLHKEILGHFANRQTILAGSTLSQSRLRFLYLFAVTDTPWSTLRLLVHSLWPRDQWLYARYGTSGWRTRLHHMLNAAQGEL